MPELLTQLKSISSIKDAEKFVSQFEGLSSSEIDSIRKVLSELLPRLFFGESDRVTPDILQAVAILTLLEKNNQEFKWESRPRAPVQEVVIGIGMAFGDYTDDQLLAAGLSAFSQLID